MGRKSWQAMTTINTEEQDRRVHLAHCYMVVMPENEFMGCKYGDIDCPAKPDKLLDTNNELKEKLFDLVDKHFPKGECKERGNAIVLVAQFLMVSEALIARKVGEAVEDENESMKEAVKHGYSPNDWCYNHDKHVPQCYACREAKWGNIFCKKFEVIINERLAQLTSGENK